jgi:DNA-binding MarR family transcriptional regulator
MSIAPLPSGIVDSRSARAANALHSLSIHILRRARTADKEIGLSPERLSLLSVLTFAGPQSVSALAEIEGVSRPAISRILGALDAQGLIDRDRNPDDGRGVVARATAGGKRLVERGRRRRVELIEEELRGLSRRDLSVLEKALGILERLERR